MSKISQAVALEMRLKGLTYAEIGKSLGCTRQRVQQLIRPPMATYNFIKRRANNKCEQCGIELSSGHVHHVSCVENYNDIENLQYLCVSCHRKAHPETGSRRKSKFPKSISFHAPPKLAKQVRKMAKEQGRTVTDMVRRLIHEGILLTNGGKNVRSSH